VRQGAGSASQFAACLMAARLRPSIWTLDITTAAYGGRRPP
jgi:hypothetical protein